MIQGTSCCVPACYNQNANLPPARCDCCTLNTDDYYEDIDVNISSGVLPILIIILIICFKFFRYEKK